jgi:peptide/nickel transport system substrate-binding protein
MLDSRPLSRRLGACLAIFALVAAACGSSTATPTTAPGTAAPTGAAIATGTVGASPAGTPDNTPRGGTINIINGSDGVSWDPTTTQGTYPGSPMDPLAAAYGFLVYTDINGQVVGSMAKSLTTTDGITWTLKLRGDAVKFTDGTPYDAEAVKYNWDRAADPATAAPTQKWVATWNTGMTVVDSTTLTIKLPQADSVFAYEVAALCPFIASPTALRAAAKKTDIKPVGAGAFTLVSWDQGVKTVMKRNPNYWDQPRPYLDELDFTIIAQTNSRIATVVQGGATMMAGYPYQFGTNNKADGVTMAKVAIRGINFAYFNATKGIFADLRARQAFYAAIDPVQLLAAYTQSDLPQPATSYFGAASPLTDPSLKLPKYDPAKAQSLIDALAADGKAFKVDIVSDNNSDNKRFGDYLAQALNAYKGVTATVTQMDQSLTPARCKTQLDFDICYMGGVSVFNGPEPLTTNLFGPGGTQNFGQYSSPTMDAALAAAKAAGTAATQKAAYVTVQQTLYQDLPIYLFGEQFRYLLLRNNTGGLVPSNQGILQSQYLYVCPSQCLPSV